MCLPSIDKCKNDLLFRFNCYAKDLGMFMNPRAASLDNGTPFSACFSGGVDGVFGKSFQNNGYYQIKLQIAIRH